MFNLLLTSHDVQVSVIEVLRFYYILCSLLIAFICDNIRTMIFVVYVNVIFLSFKMYLGNNCLAYSTNDVKACLNL